MLEGKNLKDSAVQNIKKSIENIKNKVEKKLKGNGIKRVAKSKKVIYRKQSDIFDSE